MESRYAWVFGVIGGLAIGYLTGVRWFTDVWIGGGIAITYAIAIYGFLAFPEYRSRWSSSHSRFWFTLLGVLTPIVMLIPIEGPVLSGIETLPLMILLGGVWIGGINAGIVFERASRGNSDS